jgi:multiple sugar transport system substrate-binding protein
MADLSPVVNAAGGPDGWYENSVLMYEGKPIAIPYGGSSGVLWVRTDLLEQNGLGQPKDWDDWLNAAETMTQDFQGDGRIDQYGMAIPLARNRWTAIHLWMLMWQNGATMFDENLNVVFDSPETIEALEYLGKLAEFTPPDALEYSYYQSINTYTSGAVGMSFYAGRMLPALARYAPQIGENTLAITVPYSKYRINQWGWDGYAVFKEAENLQETIDVVRHLTTTDWAVEFGLSVPGHIIPGAKDLAESPKWMEDPIVQDYEESYRRIITELDYMMEESREAGIFQDGKYVPEQGVLNPYMAAIVGAMVTEDVVQKYILGDVPADEAVAWGHKRMVQVKEQEMAAQ